MSMRLVFKAAAGQYDRAFNEIVNPIATAATGAIDDAKKDAVTGGRAAIASGGLGPKWQNTLRGVRYPKTGTSIDAAAWIYHKIPYAWVFQTGATIPGSPLLWLPLKGVPAKINGKHTTASLYVQTVGPLHTIKVAGKPPMLAGYMRGAPGSKVSLAKLRAGSALARLGVRRGRSDTGRAGVVSVPLFVGVSAVKLRKRFDIGPAARSAASRLGQYYLRRIQQQNT